MRTTLAGCGDGWSEDTRISYIKQVIILLGFALCLVMFDPHLACASSASDSTINIVPTKAGMKTRPAALHPQLEGPTGNETDERSQSESLTIAEGALAAGDYAAVEELLAEAFGADVVSARDARAPLVTQSLLLVRNAPGERTVSVQLMDADDGKSASGVITSAATALRGLTGVTANQNVLTVTLSYSDTDELLAWQDRLDAALPDLPELAMLSSALSTRHLEWPVHDGLISRTQGYAERIDLSDAESRWRSEAAKLEHAAAEIEGSTDRLDKIRAALWRAHAHAWRELTELSRATVHLELYERGDGPEWIRMRAEQLYKEQILRREWAVPAGQARQLEASVHAWRYDRLALSALGALLLVVLVFVAVAWISR